MKLTLIRILAGLALFAAMPLRAQQPADLEYRDFKGGNGKIIKAALLDKNDTQISLLLQDGKRTAVAIANLSDEDREYVNAWSKEKAAFIIKCRSLTVRELLELRGYESFEFQLKNNSIQVQGKINGKPARFLIDTGAGGSVLHAPFAKDAGCDVGPMTEEIYGVAGKAPAAITTVPSLTLGEAVFKNRKMLSTDLLNGSPKGAPLSEEAIFGADLMTQLDAVISYKERRIFLRPDLSDENTVAAGAPAKAATDEKLAFRLFKTTDNKTYRGEVLSKSSFSITIKQPDGKQAQLPIDSLVADDQKYARNWSEAGAFFLKHCQNLTLEELLTLRKYQSFEYTRRGNHVFVDGTLNGHNVTYMIDTGADSTCLHIDAARENGCQVGELDQEIHGIGGTAKAAVTMIKELTMGRAKLTNRRVLSTDLARNEPDHKLDHVGIFGADFMRELDAVITYRENKVFLIQH